MSDLCVCSGVRSGENRSIGSGVVFCSWKDKDCSKICADFDGVVVGVGFTDSFEICYGYLLLVSAFDTMNLTLSMFIVNT